LGRPLSARESVREEVAPHSDPRCRQTPAQGPPRKALFAGLNERRKGLYVCTAGQNGVRTAIAVCQRLRLAVRLHDFPVTVIKESPFVIVSFGDKRTEDLYHGNRSARVRRIPADVVRTASRKLDMINAAHTIQDLRSPPANRLEALRGDMAGLHSIRVNDQWRIVFRWKADGAHDVQLMDYH